MAVDKMQAQRFELKYLVPDETALAARDFVRCYLDLDEYGATLPNLSYPVHSLYIDSDDLKLYQSTINGDKNRFKLRLRYYDERPESPIFFEIKRRTNSTISKQRAGVRREMVAGLLRGDMPSPAHLISKEPRHFVALQNFCRLMANLQASPKAHIFYLREAWISRHDNSVRVTMDRQVMCDAEPTARLSTQMISPKVIFSDVILELKFTNRFPMWFKDLVQVFGLTQCGAAKYVDGVFRVGEHAVARSFAFDGASNFDKVVPSLTISGGSELTSAGLEKTEQ
jgi:hypothetical protein